MTNGWIGWVAWYIQWILNGRWTVVGQSMYSDSKLGHES